MKLSIPDIKKKMELSLGEMINILSVEHTYETVIDMTREFILTSESDDIRKKGLHFLYMHGFYEDLKIMIEKNAASPSISCRRWADLYQLGLERSFGSYSPQEFLVRIKGIHAEDAELKCLMKFLKLTVYFDMSNFGKVGETLASLTAASEGIKDTYLQSSYNTLLYYYSFMYYWIRNELVIARKYAYKALNKMISPILRSSLQAFLGLSYLYETYSQGIYHLSEALKIAQKHQLTNLIYVIEQRFIPFLSAYFKKPSGITSALTYEQAHLEIAKENYSEAVEMLRDYPVDDPFIQYYMGIASGDKQMLIRSHNNFIERDSNYFFSRMPLKALQEMNFAEA